MTAAEMGDQSFPHCCSELREHKLWDAFDSSSVSPPTQGTWCLQAAAGPTGRMAH
jgi:hypothetical protein